MQNGKSSKVLFTEPSQPFQKSKTQCCKPRKSHLKSTEFTRKHKLAVKAPKHGSSFSSIHTPTKTKRKNSRCLEGRIKSKVEHFHVLANCLKKYIQIEKEKKNPLSTGNLLNFLQAFNKSEIRPLSKNLEELIESILQSIEDLLEEQQLSKEEISKEEERYQRGVQASKESQGGSPFKENATAKKQPQYHEKEYGTWLTRDIECMTHDLNYLQNEEGRLRKIIELDEVKRMSRQERIEEARRLSEILTIQQSILTEMDQDRQDQL